MILGRDLLTALGMDLKFSEDVIIGGDGPYKGCSEPMVDLRNYEFESLMEKIVKPEESFINSYVDECLKSESTIIHKRGMRIILDARYEKANKNTVMREQCHHLTSSERENILTLKYIYIYSFFK